MSDDIREIKIITRAVWFAVCLILGIVLGTVLALGDPLTANVTVNLTVNGSDSTAAYPGGSAVLNLSENSTAQLTFPLDLHAQNLTLNLTPGQLANVTGAYDVLGLYCQAPASATVCSTTKDLASGEAYSQVGGSCDLHFTCASSTITLANGTACPANTTVFERCTRENNQTNLTIYKNVTIEKTGNLFSVTLDNRTTLISSDFTNATQSIEVAYICPLSLQNVTTEADGEQLFEICTQYGPLFASWLNLTLNRCFDNFDAYRDFVKTRDEVVAKASQDLSDARADNGKKDGIITTLTAQVANLNDIIVRDQEREQMYVIVMSLMGFTIAALIVGVVVLAHRAGAEG